MMASKLLYLLMDCETFNHLLALKHVRGVIKALQTSIIIVLTNIATLV